MTTHRGRPGPGGNAAIITRWGNHRGQLPTSRCQPLPAYARAPTGQAGGLIRLSGRTPKAGTPNQSSCRRGSAQAPRTQVRLAAPLPPIPGRRSWSPRTERQPPHRQTPAPTPRPSLPRPPGMIRSPGGRIKDALQAPATPAGPPARSLTRPARSQNTAAIRSREQTQARPKPGQVPPNKPRLKPLASSADTGKAARRAFSPGFYIAQRDAVFRVSGGGRGIKAARSASHTLTMPQLPWRRTAGPRPGQDQHDCRTRAETKCPVPSNPSRGQALAWTGSVSVATSCVVAGARLPVNVSHFAAGGLANADQNSVIAVGDLPVIGGRAGWHTGCGVCSQG